MIETHRDETLGVIGLGAMGTPMAVRALESGTSVVVTARRRERAARLESGGAAWAATPRELAARASVVLVMVPDLPQVEELLAGPDGLVSGEGRLVVAVGSTVSPVAVRALAERVEADTAARVRIVDCPVSGGVEGAVAGSLSIMMGGPADAVAAVRRLLAPMGRTAHLGGSGAGAIAKVANQMIVGATVLAIGEAVVLAERSGLDVAQLLEILGGGYAGSRILETRARRFVEHDHTTSGAAKYMDKDLGFAVALADATRTNVVGLPAVRAAFHELVDVGLGDLDLAVVQRFIEER